MSREELFEGDRVYVPRITTDETITLKIRKFLGTEDVEDPDVELLVQEFGTVKQPNGKSGWGLVRQCFRHAKFSELEDAPTRRTRGGAAERRLRNLTPVQCGCGCGQETSGAQFRQGHDAKLKSRLKKTIAGKIDGDVEEAQAELIKRGWDK